MHEKEKPEKHFTASALILDDKKVLLVKHKKLGVWLYPGGHIESWETPDEALIREVKEETGLDIEILSSKDDNLADKEAMVYSLHLPYAFLCEKVGDHFHNDLIYLCKIVKGRESLKHDQRESDGIDFFGIDDLGDIKLFSNFRKLLKQVLSKE